MPKRPITASYIFFYLLLSTDTWRILGGFLLAIWLGPIVTKGQGLGQAAEVMVWVMILAIGWSALSWPAKKITEALQKAVRRAAK